MKLANSVVKKSVSVLLSGADSISSSTLTYASLAELYGSFEYFNMNKMIVSPAISAKIASMEQLSDTKADADGKMILPFGAEMIKTSAINNSKIIGIDSSFALEFITNSDLVIETDKLIERQLDKITVSIICGFKKISPDAVKVLVIG